MPVVTKDQFVFSIVTQCAAGAETAAIYKKYHPADVEKLVEIVFDGMINELIEKTGDLSVLDNYVFSYPNDAYPDGIAVLYDEARGEWYSDLPVAPMSLPKNLGIRRIGPLQDPNTSFIYRENSSTWVFSALEVDKIVSEVRFEVERMRVYYRNIDGKVVNQVRMMIIPGFSEIDDDDPVFFPATTGIMIFQAVSDIMLGRRNVPENVYNNNNAKSV